VIKHYCDICKEYITRNYVSERLEINVSGATYFVDGFSEDEVPNVHIEIIVGTKGTINGGELCLRCLLDFINGGKYKYIKREDSCSRSQGDAHE